jgi:hypothetical protein
MIASLFVASTDFKMYLLGLEGDLLRATYIPRNLDPGYHRNTKSVCNYQRITNSKLKGWKNKYESVLQYLNQHQLYKKNYGFKIEFGIFYTRIE